ncbi:hypothetical protein GP486_005026 [Trichoglossum hirsutum]|uniref:3-carboxymuconate cyclase n=1 Tax=Trichoglossum hirsutum TaxID=265104 RepID=A0A9P8RN09_9PEZI|nr:hypothetical protein GP486_005026 [Trichoglossum hirsutum]
MVCTTNALRLLAALLTILLTTTALPTPNNGKEGTISLAPQGFSATPHKNGGPSPTAMPKQDKQDGGDGESKKKDASGSKQPKEKQQSQKQGSNEKPKKQCKQGPAAVVAAAGTNSTANTPAAKGAKVVYYITNDADNAIVALRVGADGKLSDGSVTLTGGNGGNGIQKGAAAKVDPLFSQSAVRVGSGMIMAVNAGSNTLSLFTIDPEDGTKLTPAGKPVDTMGDFPVTVGFSDKLKQACVANTGAKSGVACFKASAQGLQPLQQTQRALPIGQTTPPTGPEGTISHALFNSDSSALLVSVKGDPAKNDSGFMAVYPVGADGSVANRETRSSPAGTAVLFGMANIDASTVLATDASFGAAVLSLSSSSQSFSTVSKTPIGDQKATCWAALSPATGSVFVTDVGANHLVEIDPADGKLLRDLDLDNQNPGMIDLAAAGNFVYALSPGDANTKTKVVVFDVSAGKGSAKQVQNFQPAKGSPNSMGMTFA